MPIEMLVPIGIFVVGNIVISAMLGSLGIGRMIEGQKAAGAKLASTAAYDAPFASGGQGKR